MWIETDTGIINLDRAERIAVTPEGVIHIYRSDVDMMGSIRFTSHEEATKAYEQLREKLEVES